LILAAVGSIENILKKSKYDKILVPPSIAIKIKK
jgi:hypothetical protein